MKALAIFFFLPALLLAWAPNAFARDAAPAPPTRTLIGHASVKIKTSLGSVVYIDPSYGETLALEGD